MSSIRLGHDPSYTGEELPVAEGVFVVVAVEPGARPEERRVRSLARAATTLADGAPSVLRLSATYALRPAGLPVRVAWVEAP